MGWSSGSELFGNIIKILKKEVKDVDSRVRIYKKLIDMFENMDCDTLPDCIGMDTVFDIVWEAKMVEEYGPNWRDE